MRAVAKAARVAFLARAQAAEPSSSQIFLLENDVVMTCAARLLLPNCAAVE